MLSLPSNCSKSGNIFSSYNKQYKLAAVLGKGSYGPLYLAKQTLGKSSYHVIKCLTKSGHKVTDFHLKEIELMKKLTGHKNIIALEFICETPASFYIGMEHCCHGDLYDAITKPQNDHPYPSITGNFEVIKHIFLEILEGVIYSHGNSVYHRDLKPENVLIGRNGTVKIADFGLATSNFWSDEYGCGSSFYMSPELQDKHFCAKNKFFSCYSSQDTSNPIYCSPFADIWSLGVIFINLIFGRNPWKTATMSDPTFKEFTKNPKILLYLFPLSKTGYNICISMLQLDPSKRASASTIHKLVSNATDFFSKPKNMTPKITKNEYPKPQNIIDSETPNSNRHPNTNNIIQTPQEQQPFYSIEAAPNYQNPKPILYPPPIQNNKCENIPNINIKNPNLNYFNDKQF
ncbi:hypothetical protein BB559_000212 [Furculomyces boomerangus]|uniref:non-specific serine/threonine protein kinase n=1 Tax=Furculomyces boomerangus TaxID=61424 RepID=A0A2T9Z5Z7_9FUNG|nr:hypothetical protein BB559_000212 [Furculomyces boomerangus]